jgi:hypothetical protein
MSGSLQLDCEHSQAPGVWHTLHAASVGLFHQFHFRSKATGFRKPHLSHSLSVDLDEKGYVATAVERARAIRPTAERGSERDQQNMLIILEQLFDQSPMGQCPTRFLEPGFASVAVLDCVATRERLIG